MARKYGWHPDTPDFRDKYRTKAPFYKAFLLPKSADLRPGMPPVYDQGETSSCTANAIGAAIQYNRIKEKLQDFVPSRLFIYFLERDFEGDINQDGGAEIKDGIKMVSQYGVCPETEWPFEVANLTVRPTDACYADAKKNLVTLYERVDQNLVQLKTILAGGEPIVFGITVYDSFESDAVASTGVVPMPLPSEKSQGGHAILLVGYDDARNAFLFRNSWADSWGLGGYAWIPYDYVTNSDLATDFWVIKTVA